MRLLFSTARSRCPRYCYGRRRAKRVLVGSFGFRPSRAEREVVATSFTAVTHPVGAAPYQRQAQTAERRLGQRICRGVLRRAVGSNGMPASLTLTRASPVVAFAT
jgi:hypothetical protein